MKGVWTIATGYRRPILLTTAIVLWSSLQIFSMLRTTPTYDEPEHIEFGIDLLNNKVEKASQQKMPVTALNALPLLSSAKYTGARSVPFSEDHSRTPQDWLMLRLPTLVMGIMVILVITLWSKQLFGWPGALVSFTAALFCPTLAAHSALATTDVPCTLAFLVAHWGCLNFVKKRNWVALLLMATGIVIAQLTKSTAVILLPAGVGALAYATFIRPGGTNEPACGTRAMLSKLLIQLGLFFSIVLLCINLGYGFHKTMLPISAYLTKYDYENARMPEKSSVATVASLVRPLANLPVPLPYVFVHTFFKGIQINATESGLPSYMFGRLSQKGFWYYFPIAFLIKVPIPLLVLSGWACYGIVRRKHAEGLFVVFSAGLLFLTFSLGCKVQIGIRYLLPVLSLLYVAIGVTPELCRKYGVAGRRFMPMLLLWLGASSLSFYPHWLSYVNEFIQPRADIYRYVADSNLDWGQNDWYLNRYLLDHPLAKVEPTQPVSGEIIVSANNLVGITAPADKYLWLRQGYRPAGTIAYSWLLYQVP